MSIIEMSTSKYGYQRLNKAEGEEDKEGTHEEEQREVVLSRSSRNWWKFRRLSSRRRTKVRIPGLRRFLRRRARVFSSFRGSWIKVWKRLKEGKAHFGDLFAGNYMFVQVSPTPVVLASDKAFMAQHAYGLPYKYSLQNLSSLKT